MNGATESVERARPPHDFDVTVETSRRGYRLFAPLYDVVFGASLHHGRRMAIEALDCRAGDHVLEVCVGSGLSLALYPKDTHVTGIDLSGEMLA
jgi:phosphatidylethanolamine/phosphatidyl-N-methylethanolamine N-methyltransferase